MPATQAGSDDHQHSSHQLTVTSYCDCSFFAAPSMFGNYLKMHWAKKSILYPPTTYHFVSPSLINMKSVQAAVTLALAAVASTTPIARRQAQQPDTVYGVDPAKSFYLSAYDGSEGYYTLQPFYVSGIATLGLQTVLEGGSTNASSPRANFTLSGSHYGTQLYTYKPGICTSAASCPTDPPNLVWSNDSPVDNQYLTFHQGVDQPNFGGLAFYGAYHGGDFEAGESNYLVGAGDSDLTAAFSVCDLTTNTDIRILSYHGTNSSCVPVTVTAYQA
ncbi:hypothetical protein GGR57DRAFT_339926 [Xylariaceae sp. FL1272]|nr:hypothetical protein GGR57DRAFT_339926 [Xylariaceae sp. FL1272]